VVYFGHPPAKEKAFFFYPAGFFFGWVGPVRASVFLPIAPVWGGGAKRTKPCLSLAQSTAKILAKSLRDIPKNPSLKALPNIFPNTTIRSKVLL
jgi:hypothetical protein